MPMQKLKTVRVTPQTFERIQWLMRLNGEKQHGLLQRVIDTEFKRVERTKNTLPDWNRR